MATLRWEGGATPVAQVNTFAFAATWEADDLIRVIAGNKIKDLTAGSTTTATVVSNTDTNIDALDADTYPEITSDESGVTASSNSTTLTLTANEPGVPFTITLTPLESDGSASGSQTIEGGTSATSGTASVVNAGPQVWSTAANWDTGAVPGAGDTVYIDNTDDGILYGLSNAGATITAFYVFQSFTGTIGLPKFNQLGTEYPEYRTEYLTIDCTTVDIGWGPGQGSGRIKLNNGTVQTAVTVHNTGSPEEDGLEAFLWKGTHASNVMTVRNGSVGVAVFGGETAVLATLTVDGGEVRCGRGTTLTTINANHGTLEVASNIGGTLTNLGCDVTIDGTATAAQLTLRGGITNYNSTGTISGNTVLAGDAVLDFSQAPGSVTVSNAIELYGPNCRLIDPHKRVASLIVDFNEGAASDQVEWGTNLKLTRAATT